MTQRTINRSLIIHNDLELGYGTVSQERGDATLIEQKIELAFIFRTLDEIRALDTLRYTRVYLHTLGPLIEYYWDSTDTQADDGDDVLAPVPFVSVGRWLKINSHAPSYTTTQLADITHAVNTSNFKQPGAMVWNVTLGRPLWAVGSADGDLWVDANGTTVHTPA
jgi:hypothetical protein